MTGLSNFKELLITKEEWNVKSNPEDLLKKWSI